MNQDIKVVTICGSMRYADEMKKIAWDLEVKKGLSVIQCVYNVNNESCDDLNFDTLAKLHKKKIDISDAIYVVNIDGYIGSSAKGEIEYAISKGKEVIYHEKLK